MEPEETNQRMVALQGEAQRAPTSLVTCSSLAGSVVWGEGWDKWRKEGRMGGSNDVRSDLWKDEMIRDQRAGEGWKGVGEGWNNAPMGGHMEGEVNGERDERKRGEEWAAVWAGGGGGGDGGGGGAYHGKFCSSDWSAEREPSSIMYIMDPWEIFIHIKWSSTRKCLAATAQPRIARGGNFNILFCLYLHTVNSHIPLCSFAAASYCVSQKGLKDSMTICKHASNSRLFKYLCDEKRRLLRV